MGGYDLCVCLQIAFFFYEWQNKMELWGVIARLMLVSVGWDFNVAFLCVAKCIASFSVEPSGETKQLKSGECIVLQMQLDN